MMSLSLCGGLDGFGLVGEKADPVPEDGFCGKPVEGREAVSMLCSGEAAAVDDGAAERRAVAAQKVFQRMHRDIGARKD